MIGDLIQGVLRTRETTNGDTSELISVIDDVVILRLLVLQDGIGNRGAVIVVRADQSLAAVDVRGSPDKVLEAQGSIQGRPGESAAARDHAYASRNGDHKKVQVRKLNGDESRVVSHPGRDLVHVSACRELTSASPGGLQVLVVREVPPVIDRGDQDQGLLPCLTHSPHLALVLKALLGQGRDRPLALEAHNV